MKKIRMPSSTNATVVLKVKVLNSLGPLCLWQCFFNCWLLLVFWLVDWVQEVDWSNMWLDCGGWVGQYPSLGIKYAPPSQRSSTRFQLSLIMPSLTEPF